MTDSTPTFSKSIKKVLTDKNRTANTRSMNARDASPLLKNFYAPESKDSYEVVNFKHEVTFPVELRAALPNDYRRLEQLYINGIEIHNQHIASGKFPEDAFDWFNEPEICAFMEHANSVFADLGKNLAYKKRRLSPFDAQTFLFNNVTSVLDKFTFQPGCQLQFLFHRCFDVLVQSYLSNFIEKAFEYSELKSHTQSININFKSICNTPREANFIKQQIVLYNLRDYVIADDVFKLLAGLIHGLDTEISMSYEDMLFDVYELLPLYIKSWSPNRNKVHLDNGLVLFFYLSDGFPSFCLGTLDDDAEKAMTYTYRFFWTINGDFRCIAKLDSKFEQLEKIGLSILSILHDKLVYLFTLRKPERVEPAEYDAADQLATFTDSFHQTLEEIVPDTSDNISKHKKPVPSMTMNSFFTFMQKNFSCNVAGGKGSEVKIWRDESKIYTIGRHKKEPKIHSFLIRKILKRLGIPESDWLAALK